MRKIIKWLSYRWVIGFMPLFVTALTAVIYIITAVRAMIIISAISLTIMVIIAPIVFIAIDEAENRTEKGKDT